MFLRKLFSSKNKFLWVLIDLLIVIIGVYSAFLIQQYSENVKSDKERDRIITALKYEIEVFRYQMTERSSYLVDYHEEMNAVLAEQKYRDFSNYRFIEPQYDYQTLQYAINHQNQEVIDFELFNLLQSLLVEIRKIEHAERLLTEVAGKYRRIPPSLPDKSEANMMLRSQNMDHFKRFVIFAGDRAEFAARILDASVKCLKEVDDQLGLEAAKKIEEELIRRQAPAIESEEVAVQMGLLFFPKFTEEELRAIYQDAVKTSGEQSIKKR